LAEAIQPDRRHGADYELHFHDNALFSEVWTVMSFAAAQLSSGAVLGGDNLKSGDPGD